MPYLETLPRGNFPQPDGIITSPSEHPLTSRIDGDGEEGAGVSSEGHRFCAWEGAEVTRVWKVGQQVIRISHNKFLADGTRTHVQIEAPGEVLLDKFWIHGKKSEGGISFG